MNRFVLYFSSILGQCPKWYESKILKSIVSINNILLTAYGRILCLTGGWWQIEEFEEITGAVAIQMGMQGYMQAQDNGLLCYGKIHTR